MMKTEQIKNKIAKLEGKKDKLSEEIESLEEQLPHEVKTRGDPVVEFC